MRCKLLHEMVITNPAIKSVEHKLRLQHEYLSGRISVVDYKRAIEVLAPAGTVIEHPEAWRLVEHGVAEPVDQECIAHCDSKRLARLALTAERFAKLEVAQASGQPIDASDEAVEAFQEKRAKRRAQLDEAPKLVVAT